MYFSNHIQLTVICHTITPCDIISPFMTIYMISPCMVIARLHKKCPSMYASLRNFKCQDICGQQVYNYLFLLFEVLILSYQVIWHQIVDCIVQNKAPSSTYRFSCHRDHICLPHSLKQPCSVMRKGDVYSVFPSIFTRFISFYWQFLLLPDCSPVHTVLAKHTASIAIFDKITSPKHVSSPTNITSKGMGMACDKQLAI